MEQDLRSAGQLHYVQYHSDKESQYLSAIRQLISKDLSEPYSIYVYRYFLYQWGDLCYLALDEEEELVGVVVSKLELHRGGPLRGYVAMLAVRKEYRGQGIATKLVRMAIDAMIERNADEIALETEITNTAAIKLYERLGFLRSKRLHRYYLNGNSAFRLVLYLKEGVGYTQIGYDAHDAALSERPSSA
ncbi:MAG: N-alpha-acetyltransferase mak3 [Sclerophora amabilis]|nr:MAG: N-alpha-acetyltransferase mak3 [Sclerophora amabilis]